MPTQSEFVDQAGVYGTSTSAKQPLQGFFSSVGKLATIIAGGPVSADAAASKGAKQSDFPANGDPIVAGGGGIEAATRTKAQVTAQPPQFSPGIPPWMGLVAVAAVLFLVSKMK